MGTRPHFLRKHLADEPLAKVDVLVIDDLVLRPLVAQQAADLLEIMKDRHQLRSTIATRQLPVGHFA